MFFAKWLSTPNSQPLIPLHDPMYLISWEQMYYNLLRPCRLCSMKSLYPPNPKPCFLSVCIPYNPFRAAFRYRPRMFLPLGAHYPQLASLLQFAPLGRSISWAAGLLPKRSQGCAKWRQFFRGTEVWNHACLKTTCNHVPHIQVLFMNAWVWGSLFRGCTLNPNSCGLPSASPRTSPCRLVVCRSV